jgi:hypothetical protein
MLNALKVSIIMNDNNYELSLLNLAKDEKKAEDEPRIFKDSYRESYYFEELSGYEPFE